jgi:hypothetical protein
MHADIRDLLKALCGAVGGDAPLCSLSTAKAAMIFTNSPGEPSFPRLWLTFRPATAILAACA